MYSVEIRLDCAAFMMPGHGRSLQSSSLAGKCWKTWFTTMLSLWFYSDFTGWFVLRDFHRLLATKICIAETARALMRPSRSDGALRRPIRQILEPVAKRIATPTMATPLAPARPSEALETSQISQISQASVSVVAGTSIDQMQRQLQKAEAMLNCCVQSVEAAWDLSAQRLTEFDQKLSALDVRLVELSQKQVDDEETEARRQTARLVTLENRLDELVKRLENPQPEPQLNLESRLSEPSRGQPLWAPGCRGSGPGGTVQALGISAEPKSMHSEHRWIGTLGTPSHPWHHSDQRRHPDARLLHADFAGRSELLLGGGDRRWALEWRVRPEIPWSIQSATLASFQWSKGCNLGADGRNIKNYHHTDKRFVTWNCRAICDWFWFEDLFWSWKE